MFRLLIRTGALGALSIAVSGCAAMGDMAATSVVVAVVDRAISDHEKSECRMAEWIRTGTLCKEVAEAPAPPPQVYCFKTLGRTDCYGHPDPYDLARSTRTRAPAPLIDPPAAPAPVLAASENGRSGSEASKAPKPGPASDIELTPASYTVPSPRT